MRLYCVNKHPEGTQGHRVHRMRCRYWPAPENRQNLGVHSTVHNAIEKAKEYYPNAKGCHYCSRAAKDEERDQNRNDSWCDWATAATQLTIHFWGKPNDSMSDVFYLRWGDNGTKRMCRVAGVWYDDEKRIGGGVIDLVQMELKMKERKHAIEWLAKHGFFDKFDQEGDKI